MHELQLAFTMQAGRKKAAGPRYATKHTRSSAAHAQSQPGTRSVRPSADTSCAVESQQPDASLQKQLQRERAQVASMREQLRLATQQLQHDRAAFEHTQVHPPGSLLPKLRSELEIPVQ